MYIQCTCIAAVFILTLFHSQVPGRYDLHLRMREWERYFCGRDAKEKYPDHLIHLIEGGIPVKTKLLPEILTGFYYACHMRPQYTPVVILEPPGLWNKVIRSEVAYLFAKMFHHPSVGFLSSAVATLCR